MNNAQTYTFRAVVGHAHNAALLQAEQLLARCNGNVAAALNSHFDGGSSGGMYTASSCIAEHGLLQTCRQLACMRLRCQWPTECGSGTRTGHTSLGANTNLAANTD